ncbi:MAG TPA: hypothetical protein VFB33_13850 [Candidatus Binataceae bacterium]|nr:hypothetical protein [Candidatus Binataceae bacterium]
MIYLAAMLIVAGVALFVAAPLGDGVLGRRRAAGAATEVERLKHERGLAMQGLRELEFDREMGKLSEADYAALHENLMARALEASAALARLRAVAHAPCNGSDAALGRRAGASQAESARPARVRFCARCGAEAVPGNFCCECGAPLASAPQAAAWAQR